MTHPGIIVAAFFAGAVLGAFLTILHYAIGMHRLKDENERLNRELHKLTDRDERGRFKGGK